MYRAVKRAFQIHFSCIWPFVEKYKRIPNTDLFIVHMLNWQRTRQLRNSLSPITYRSEIFSWFVIPFVNEYFNIIIIMAFTDFTYPVWKKGETYVLLQRMFPQYFNVCFLQYLNKVKSLTLNRRVPRVYKNKGKSPWKYS